MVALSNSKTAQHKDDITTVTVGEVHNRSAQSDYVLALTLAAMQKFSRLKLVLTSATGDHHLVEKEVFTLPETCHEGRNALRT